MTLTPGDAGMPPEHASPAPVGLVHAGLSEPSGWVRQWAHLIAPGGTVLDVASGAGRHARWLAALGHPVTALDRDAAALATMRGVAGIATLACDLEGAPWPLPDDARFAAIVVTNYLYRPLMPRLIDALAPGGVLIYETFAQGNETVGKPSNPAFLLAPGELLAVCMPALRVIARIRTDFSHNRVKHSSSVSVRCARCARRSPQRWKTLPVRTASMRLKDPVTPLRLRYYPWCVTI